MLEVRVKDCLKLDVLRFAECLVTNNLPPGYMCSRIGRDDIGSCFAASLNRLKKLDMILCGFLL